VLIPRPEAHKPTTRRKSERVKTDIDLSPFCVVSRAVAILWVDTESPIVA